MTREKSLRYHVETWVYMILAVIALGASEWLVATIVP